MLIPGTRASWLAGAELLLGLWITGLLLAGLRLAWRHRRESHVRLMRSAVAWMVLFLVLFVVNLGWRGGVEALESGSPHPLLVSLLGLHILLSLAGGVGLVLLILWGWRGAADDPGALVRHRRWGGFWAGFWLVNTLLGALVFLGAYVL